MNIYFNYSRFIFNIQTNRKNKTPSTQWGGSGDWCVGVHT